MKPCGAAARASAADRAARIRGLVQAGAAGAGGAGPGRQWQPIEHAVGQETDAGAAEGGGEPLCHAGEAGDDLGKVLQAAAAAQLFGVVHGGLETQDVLALGGGLQLQAPEGHLEPGQAVLGFPGHGFLRGRAAGTVLMRTVLQPEDGPQRRDVQPGPGPVQYPVK